MYPARAGSAGADRGVMATRTSRIVSVSGPALAVAFLLHVIWLNCTAEDAFITFRFAKNLASGHGLVWNVGEPAVEGYPTFSGFFFAHWR